MPTCSNCGHRNSEQAKFCEECAAPLEAPSTPREQRKVVTVLFCDVTGSTALGESTDPEALRALLARYFERMKTIVEAHGGTVEKFIGDAVMAVFGVPQVHEDDAFRACRAAVEMREALPELGLQARIGLNTGEVVTGTEERLATGDAVNVAARLEQAAQPGEILVGEPTLALVRGGVETEPAEPLELKGKAQPVQAFRLVSVTGEAVRRREAPMVGRVRELDRLRGAFGQAADNRTCQLFTILGAAGVGKSRLTHEFLRDLDAPVVVGRCLAYGEAITYWPVVEVLKQLGAIPSDLAAANSLRSLLGEIDEGTSADEIAWAFRKLLEEQAQERPLVCVFDDIHWGEETFLDLIEHISDLSRDAPILLLCLARPELLDKRSTWGGGKLNATTVLLEPLEENDSERLVANLLGTAELSSPIRQTILETAEGNPLFVEEMLAMLIDDGLLELRNGGWQASGDLSSLRAPPTIHALLAARLDRLAADERAVIECAAVEGTVFHRAAVAELVPEGLRARLGEELAALVRKELIRPERSSFVAEEAFRFRHILIRDAAYDGLPKKFRAELHERFATWLERAAGDRISEYEEILAYHLEQAVSYRSELGLLDDRGRALGSRAGERLATAGERAFRRGDMEAASSLLARAERLLPPASTDRMMLLVRLGAALEASGELSRAERVLGAAVDLADRAGEKRIELRARLERYAVRELTDLKDQRESASLAEQAIPVFEAEGDEEGLARAWEQIGDIHWMDCQYAARAEALERALVHAERAGARGLEAEIYQGLALSIAAGPTPASRAIERCELLLARARGQPVLEAGVRDSLAVLYAMQCRTEEARRTYTSSAERFAELGLKLRMGLASLLAARVELLARDPPAAERAFRTGYELFSEIGEKKVFSTLAGQFANFMCEQGNYDEAARLAREAREATSSGDVISEVLCQLAEAKLAARVGDNEAAERPAREAVTTAERTDALNLQGDALCGLAEVHQTFGRTEEAAEALEQALDRYERKQNLAMVAQVRPKLGALRAGTQRVPRDGNR